MMEKRNELKDLLQFQRYLLKERAIKISVQLFKGKDNCTMSVFIKRYSLIIIGLLVYGIAIAQTPVTEIEFKQPSAADTGISATLNTIVRVRKINEQYATGGLYLITQVGDYEELFEKENRKAIEQPMIDQSWRYCSVFSVKNNNGVILGRNWDNQNVGSVIVNLYKPSNGYSSISFSRAIDMGFPLNIDIKDMAPTPLGERLLLTPFYSYDGMNDQGLSATVTGIGQVKVTPQEGKEMIFIPYLIRKILDHTKSVQEAERLVEQFIPFDLDQTSFNCHLYVADASGKSVVLEYRDGQWQKTYTTASWQAMTNKVVFNVPDTTLRRICWRYNTISETMEKRSNMIGWEGGMRLLKDVSQGGTTWSVIYSLISKDLYFSVYQTWDKVYHLKGF